MTDNKVQLEIFEGPLDLLLYLVKKEEVDIYEVNLTRIAAQFIEYIDLMRELDLDVAGDFVVMAASLMYIKSRELLPVDQQAVIEEEEETEDPRWELIRQLVEYKKFKDAAAQLQEHEFAQDLVFPRLPGKPDLPADASPPKLQISIFDLINAVNVILKRVQHRDGPRDLFQDQWTVSEKIEQLTQMLQARLTLNFSDLFANSTSRMEIVVTFLALLELIRLKCVRISQPEPFSEIQITFISGGALNSTAPARDTLEPTPPSNGT